MTLATEAPETSDAVVPENWLLAQMRDRPGERIFSMLGEAARDTRYNPVSHGPFVCRHGFQSVADVNVNDEQEVDAALAEFRLEKLVFGFRKDPNVAYCVEIARAVLDGLAKREVITDDEYENLLDAVSSAAEDAAQFVARKWLREQECIPLLSR